MRTSPMVGRHAVQGHRDRRRAARLRLLTGDGSRAVTARPGRTQASPAAPRMGSSRAATADPRDEAGDLRLPVRARQLPTAGAAALGAWPDTVAAVLRRRAG